MNRRINFSAADADRWRELSRMTSGPSAPTNPATADWYRIANEAGEDDEPAVIDIYGEIGQWGVNASDFVAELRAINADSIDLHISSGGGSVYEALAIYNALIDHPANVTVYVDSIAASAASFIAQAGNKVIMGRNSELMIHDGLGVTMGNAELHREMADLLDKVSDNIASIYAARAGRVGVNVWRQRMKAETWYSAQEAVDAGLADEAAKTPKRSGAAPQASVDLSRFNYAGRAEAPAPDLRAEVDEPVAEVEHFAPAQSVPPVINIVVNGAVGDTEALRDAVLESLRAMKDVGVATEVNIDPVPTADGESVEPAEELPAPPPSPPPLPPEPEPFAIEDVEPDVEPGPQSEPEAEPEPAEPEPVEPEPEPVSAPIAASAGPLVLGPTWTESISHLLDSNTPDGWSDTVHHLLSTTQPSPHGATKEAPCR